MNRERSKKKKKMQGKKFEFSLAEEDSRRLYTLF